LDSGEGIESNQGELQDNMARDEVLVLNPLDNVGVALSSLGPGTLVRTALGDGRNEIRVREETPALHKIALCEIPEHGQVVKYGHAIGRATRPMLPGMHVHVHNLVDDYGVS
jgi:altronate dehydratase small subunit